MQNAVCVNIKADFDLGHATWRGGNAIEAEFAQGFVAAGHRPFALQDVDVHGRLVVFGRAKRLRFLAGDGRVAGDEYRHHAAQRLEAKA